MVNFRLAVYEASQLVANIHKILLEDVYEALEKIVSTGNAKQVGEVFAPVGHDALNVMHKRAIEAICARDAMAVIDPAAKGIMREADSKSWGIMREAAVYFESSLGEFVYRAGRLEPVKGG